MGVIGNMFMLLPQAIELPDWGWLGGILSFLNGIFGNAAWTMIAFTILLKLATFPLDYISRYKMKKNAVITEELKPQLEKLEKQCKGNKQLYQQRSYPLLKKEGYSTGGACLPTLITLVLFFFVLSGLNSYATFRNGTNYNALTEVYNTKYEEFTTGDDALDPNSDELQQKIDPFLVEKYDELNPSWLWIKNPWRPDVSYSDGFLKFMAGVNPIATYEEFTHTDSKSNYGVGALTIPSQGDAGIARRDYQNVMGAVIADKGTGNGLYILIIVAALSSFLSQFIMQKTQGAQQQPGAMGAGTMKFMMILFPIMMGFFSFSYSAVFTLYIITNSIIGLLATLGINAVVTRKMNRLREEKFSQIKYRRR